MSTQVIFEEFNDVRDLKLSRRVVISGLSSLTVVSALPVSLYQLRGAKAGPMRKRFDATSPDGKNMLAIYADAVGKMRDATTTSESSPSSWTFQWYSHWVNGDRDKTAELNRVFGTRPSPAKDLANSMWSSCQAHGDDMWLPNFLPWHRAFVLYFEAIVRQISGNDEFSLPYWDYTTDAVIPEEFRQRNDPVYGSLFVENRNAGVNQGTPIDQIGVPFPDGAFNLDSLKENDYLEDPSGVPQGFNAKLNSELHGFVHVKVGTRTNMGRIPYAARDPIFWLHHCNIDRIWAAWNEFGGSNPAADEWVSDQRHVFADQSGNRVEVTNGEMTATGPLGYTYDKLPPRPTGAGARVAEAPSSSETRTGAVVAQTEPLASSQEKVILGSEPTAVTLSPGPRAAAGPLSELPGDPSKRRYLVIGNLETNAQPGVVYNVYAKSGEASERQPASGRYLGSIQFFDADPVAGRAARSRRFVFDVTEALAGVPEADRLTYFIVPAGQPEADAQPAIGSIDLIEK